MEGFPKALLRDGRGETLLARTLRVAREADLTPILVGNVTALVAMEPAARDVVAITDAASNAGPLGGLVALLAHAPSVIAVACDMPGLDSAALRALAAHPEDAPILAARRDGHWEPLFARYDGARVLPLARARLANGQLALQGLLDAAGAVPFAGALNACILHDVDTVLDATRAGLVRNHP